LFVVVLSSFVQKGWWVGAALPLCGQKKAPNQNKPQKEKTHRQRRQQRARQQHRGGVVVRQRLRRRDGAPNDAREAVDGVKRGHHRGARAGGGQFRRQQQTRGVGDGLEANLSGGFVLVWFVG
jgi:hypothetical protein